MKQALGVYELPSKLLVLNNPYSISLYTPLHNPFKEFRLPYRGYHQAFLSEGSLGWRRGNQGLQLQQQIPTVPSCFPELAKDTGSVWWIIKLLMNLSMIHFGYSGIL